MSPNEIVVRALLAEIRDDLAALDHLVGRIAEIRPRVATLTPPDPVQVMAAAAYLHHAYTAIEAIHERIVVRIDGVRPSGDRSHTELLTLVALDVPGVRPAVIEANTRAQLSRLLRFRHFFRHAYRIDLLWEEIAPLLGDSAATFAAYRHDLDTFCDHLEKTSNAPPTTPS